MTRLRRCWNDMNTASRLIPSLLARGRQEKERGICIIMYGITLHTSMCVYVHILKFFLCWYTVPGVLTVFLGEEKMAVEVVM